MIKRITFIALFSLICSAISFAQGGKVGVGFILGEPTGLSGKIWIGKKTAIDAALAWSFQDNDALHVHADYLLHGALYYGIGGRIKFQDKSRFGIRIPFGIASRFADRHLDFFFEIVPLLDFVPKTKFLLNSALGLRFYF
jgi:hypothetical protein